MASARRPSAKRNLFLQPAAYKGAELDSFKIQRVRIRSAAAPPMMSIGVRIVCVMSGLNFRISPVSPKKIMGSRLQIPPR